MILIIHHGTMAVMFCCMYWNTSKLCKHITYSFRCVICTCELSCIVIMFNVSV